MKLKPGLGASYAIWPGNGVGLFYSSRTHTGRQTKERRKGTNEGMNEGKKNERTNEL